MSTLLNPPLITPKLTDRPVHEPASDWASSTLDALGPVSQVEDPIASKPTTPGLHVPGAFPSSIQQDAQYAKEAAVGAFQTAKDYVPMSLEDMKHLLENAGDTVAGYLPETVATYLPHHTTADTSLLSEPNSQNAQVALSGGEGTPSGPIVHTTAKTSFFSQGTSQDSSRGDLFEHRPTNTSLNPSQSMYPDPSGGAGIPPGPPDKFGVATPHDPNSETLRSKTGIATFPEERRQQPLPDLPFAIEKDEFTGGLGILPGDKEEGSWALLPEEGHGSKSGANTDTNSSTRLLRGTRSAELDSLTTKLRDQDISQNALPGFALFAPLPINKNTTASSTHPIVPNTTAITYPLPSNASKFKGVSLSDSELGDESLSPSEMAIDEPQNLEQGQSEPTPRQGTIPAATSSIIGQTVRKKPGFMDRLKGEVKVISGKLSHNESKVEEGKRMIGKT